MVRIALMGAGGKMGCRVSDNLRGNAHYMISHVEVSESGLARLAQRGVSAVPRDAALESAQVVVLAVPDAVIGSVASEIVLLVKPKTLVVGLDPAAAYAGMLPERSDIGYFICHPTHPPLFHDETDPEAQRDWFGGKAKQDVVCALFRGPESDYAVGERLAREMFRPVKDTYRITVEQMAILEPALVETFSSTLIDAIREAFEEAVKMGVPEPAARAFLMGHVRIQFAVLFGYADFPFSDGAKYAMSQARDLIFKPDWKEKIMNLASVKQSVREITHAVSK